MTDIPLEVLEDLGYRVSTWEPEDCAPWLWWATLVDGAQLRFCHHHFPDRYWSLSSFSTDLSRERADGVQRALSEFQHQQRLVR
jgi:hypothetical protein